MQSHFVVSLRRKFGHGGVLKAVQTITFATKGPSRSSQIDLIHKRLAGYEREQRNESAKPVRSAFLSDSLAVDNLIRNESRYEKVLQQKELEQGTQPSSSNISSACEYPLAAKPLAENVFCNENLNSVDQTDSGAQNYGDRGYFVSGDVYMDDYVLGNTTDFPDDAMTLPSRESFGPVDAVEHIEFQLPHQTENQDLNSIDDSGTLCEDVEQVGTVNQFREAIDKRCSGCGAHLHCKNGSLPGFLPEELLDKAARKKLPETVLCRRCHLLKHYNFLEGEEKWGLWPRGCDARRVAGSTPPAAFFWSINCLEMFHALDFIKHCSG
ncbi:hypothetical protein KIN20_001223 [Parelaphostrongylus tenuis]|uniref:Uncharacterized protein n=1 Tax=Parelaphostrongylus tenuis TaxID=148309 RepID=A0AAD5MEH9_PARTN|nr:hypothetical protein KIN20_001223 [Parelaphostrongylus tenuis]